MTSAKKQIHSLIERDGDLCHYCGVRTLRGAPNNPRAASRDHVIPKAHGGMDYVSNFVLACRQCNSRRGHMLFSCSCDFCESVYNEYTSTVVKAMYEAERVKIRQSRRTGVWLIEKNKRIYSSCETFTEAVDKADAVVRGEVAA